MAGCSHLDQSAITELPPQIYCFVDDLAFVIGGAPR
jgi:hypothetical protein